MSEPDPVWGVHVVEGALTAALVRRAGPDAFEVVDALSDRAPADPALALRQARALVSRRAIASRGAIVTLPDWNGALVTASVASEQYDLSENELANELMEWTRFEPEAAELRHALVAREDRRETRLVAAIPRADYARLLEVLERGDMSRLGVGLSGAATWRGATALGLVRDGDCLLSILPGLTEVFTAPDGDVRRHLLPIGETQLVGDATAADLFARDLAQLCDYHRSLRRPNPARSAEAEFVAVGLTATSPALRTRLAGVLGPKLRTAPRGAAIVTAAPGVRLPNSTPAALAGAVGAALEAFRDPAERVILRHLAPDLPPYRSRTPALVGAAVAASVLVAVAVGYATHSPPPTAARAPTVDRAGPRSAAPPRVVDEPDPVEAPAPAARLDVTPLGPGRALVRWPKAAAGKAILRQELDAAGLPVGEPLAVTRATADAGEIVDDVPGRAAEYIWQSEGCVAARARVEVPIEADLVGPGADGGARFALRRPWRQGTATLEVDVPPGGRIAGTDGVLAFDVGARLDVVRCQSANERAVVPVPRFLPDGRVERGGDGTPLSVERIIERVRRVFEADSVAPDGSRRTWSRKMTDG